MLIAAATVTHFGVTSDWALVDAAIVTIGITIIGLLWRIAVKAAKRDVMIASLSQQFTREFGGNSGGLRQQINHIASEQAEIKANQQYQIERLDEHIAQHESPRPRARRSA